MELANRIPKLTDHIEGNLWLIEDTLGAKIEANKIWGKFRVSAIL